MTEPVRQTNGAERPSWPPLVNEWVLPYLSDTGMWPVTFALLVHLAMAVALAILAAWRGALVGWAPLVALGILTFGVVRHDFRVSGRPGAITAAIGIAWSMSIGVAAIGGYTGVF